MMVSLVIDPDVFDKFYFTSKFHVQNADSLTSALNANAVLLLDDGDEMMRNINARVRELPQELLGNWWLVLPDILRTGIMFVDAADNSGYLDTCQRMARFVERSQADCLVACPKTKKLVSQMPCTIPPCELLEDYSVSTIEKKRRGYVEKASRIDLLSLPEVRHLIARMVRFTPYINFYDYQFTTLRAEKSGCFGNGALEALEKWFKGFDFVIGVWKDSMNTQTQKTVRIITRMPRDRKLHARMREIAQLINDVIVNKLRRRHRDCSIDITIKQDCNNDFTMRRMTTDRHVFAFEKGFDLFPPGDKKYRLKANTIRYDNDWTYINRIDALPDWSAAT